MYYLRRAGHACTLIEQHESLGGRLRTQEFAEDLPPDVLDAEIKQIIRLGVELRLQTSISEKEQLDALCEEFDAVLLAIGKTAPEQVERLGIKSNRKGIDVDTETYSTNRGGVFAVGNALRGNGMVVRSTADGKEAASIINQFLSGWKKLSLGYDFSSRIGRLESGEMNEFLANSITAQRSVPATGTDYVPCDATVQSERCLSCGCVAHNKCKLEHWSEVYGANPNRFPSERRPYEVIGRESSVLFEPGKCIKCELCIKIAEQAQEPLGLTFVGRGFDVRLSVPFDGKLDDALTKVAAACVAACPTAALSFADSCRSPVLTQLDLPSQTKAEQTTDCS